LELKGVLARVGSIGISYNSNISPPEILDPSSFVSYDYTLKSLRINPTAAVLQWDPS
jgi:hypothetical protein